MSCILVFVSSRYSKKMTELRPFNSRSVGNPVTMTFVLRSWKALFLKRRAPLVMCNLEIWLRYSHTFPRFWPTNMLPEPPSLKHAYKKRYWKSRCDVTSGVTLINGLRLHYLPSSYHISNDIEAIMCTKQILKFPKVFLILELWRSFKPN